jgi:hypothetical protein
MGGASEGLNRLGRGVVLSAFALGCSLAPAPEPFTIALRVVSDPGEGLAGAVVALGGAQPQLSDASGLVTARVDGREGDIVSVVVRCPEGHESPDEALPIVLRRFVDPGAVPQHEAACPPLSRQLVVAVRAPEAADLPVLVDGHELARTDARGVAHVSLDVPVGKTVELTLDTSAQPDLETPSPRQSFGDLSADEVVVFEAHLKRRQRKKPTLRVPQALPWKRNGRGLR